MRETDREIPAVLSVNDPKPLYISFSYIDHMPTDIFMETPITGDKHLTMRLSNWKEIMHLLNTRLLYDMYFRPDYETHVLAILDGQDREIGKRINEMKRQFIEDNELDTMTHPFNVEAGLNWLFRKHRIPDDMIIKMKLKFGIQVDPDEINDELMIDLL
jgi:hypothetical protein